MIPPRYELKYWCQESEIKEFFSYLEGLLCDDPHNEDKGSYCVTSLYYDSPDYRFFFEKLEGLRRRIKIRLRRYESSMDGFLELKEKQNRRILKQRIHVPKETLEAFARNDWTPLTKLAESNPVARRLNYDISLIRPHPVIVVRYEREAHFFKDDPGVRITIDRQLSCQGHDLSEAFLNPEIQLEELARADMATSAILEVKVSGPVPGVVAAALRKTGLVRRSISKYCLCIAKSDQLPLTYRHIQRQLLLSFGY